MERQRVLVIDGDESILRQVEEALSQEPVQVMAAALGEDGVSLLRRQKPCLVVTALDLPDMDARVVIKRAQRMVEPCRVIVTGDPARVDASQERLKEAWAVVKKPLEPVVFAELIHRAMAGPRPQSGYETESRAIVGRSEALRRVLEAVRRAAPSRATLLIQGESGTGKELVARAVHHLSTRKDGPFVAVNCAALPDGLLESELFGCRPGAFTDAAQGREGKFQLAHNGTLMLDEVSELPLSLQAKLLRVLQEKEITPLGGRYPLKIDVRVVAVSNQDLARCVKEGKFREDLYYRLNVVPLKVPPLRDRREDIPALVDHFLQVSSRRNERPLPHLPESVRALLMDYSWPGNVRELENTMEKLVVMGDGGLIGLPDLPEALAEFARCQWEGAPAKTTALETPTRYTFHSS